MQPWCDGSSYLLRHMLQAASSLEAMGPMLAMFGDMPEIEQDIIEYMLVAQREHWIDLV